MNNSIAGDVPINLKSQAELVNAWKKTFDDSTSSFQPEIIETLVSWILLTKDRAYKIKKALKLDFLDFSNLSSRKFYCEEEIRLNKRTAPDLYQQVIIIGGSIAHPVLNAEPILEYAVQMKRFSRESEMSGMLRDGRLKVCHVDSLARKIAYFHQNLPPLPENGTDNIYGTYDFIHRGLENNYNELRAVFSALNLETELEKLDELIQLHFAALEKREHVIGQRHSNGFVRECHGDLHMGNVAVIDDEAVLFDCIEFAPDFRCVDVICDLAFAFTDLCHFDRPDYAWRLLNIYLEETGDYEGAALLGVFGATHALVRAKVAAIRYLQSAEKAKMQSCLEESKKYMSLARTMLQDRNAGLLITCGLPGSGKSVFSLAALEKTGAIRIRSDIERKRHYGLGALQSSDGIAVNIYSDEASEITYNLLEKLAVMLLDAKFRVIIDAAFLRKSERSRFYRLTSRKNLPYVIALVIAGPDTLIRRVTARKLFRDDPSEAGPDVLAQKQRQFEPLSRKEWEYAVEILNEDGNDFRSGETDWENLERRLSIS
ncbi:MAG: AAA family ATPase [Betaproteobacteria bacterium]|nr:AAA family ATPase [Betaproteobacteria bacterium]